MRARYYHWLSPLPLLGYFGILLYLKRFDGWGAWGAAPMLLLPLGLSLALVLASVGHWFMEWRRRKRAARRQSASVDSSGARWMFWPMLSLVVAAGPWILVMLR